MSIAKREARANLISWVTSLFFAAVGVASGGVLAMVSLVAQPVEVLKKAPPEPVGDRLIYVPGERDSTRGKLWSIKRKALIQGPPGIVSLTEEELNSWFSNVARTDMPRDPKAPPPDVVFEGLNIRIAEGRVQAGLPVTLNYFAPAMKVIVQTRGELVPGEHRWYFRPNQAWIGSLPLHRIPGAMAYLTQRELEESWVPPEALAAWKRVAEVTVADRTILVRVE